MSDDLTIRQPQDPTKININQNHELNYWSKKFGKSKQAIKDAVGKVGPMVSDVKKELGV